jgi:HK97 family phage portal protein
MNLGPFTIARRTKALPLAPLSGRGGWWPISIREPYTGAWQRNDEVKMDTVLSFSAAFACTSLIMGDLGKLTLRLVQKTDAGIWEEAESPAFSPVLRRPNRYQNGSQFVETWTASKLNSGNAYVLKQRDQRRIVTALYVLDPMRVVPMVTPDGAVYYELKRDDLSGLPLERTVVPASEMIHDRMNALFHPLVGLSPIFACAVAARQGLAIQNNSSKLFSNGSVPGGVLTAPGSILSETATRLKEYWDTNFTGDNVGKVAVLGDGLKYEHLSYNAVDMQLVDQLKLSAETVCSCYHVPPYLVDVGPPPPYANVEPLLQKYYSQCLQGLINALELSLDEGLGLGRQFQNAYGTEFDPDDLIWLDAAAKSKAAQDSIGTLSPNESRKRFYSAPPVKGGDSPMVQQQYYSLEALAERDAAQPFAKPPAPAPAPAADDSTDVTVMSFASSYRRKAIEAGLHAG